MPNKCSAVGCKSGYSNETTDSTVSFHRFPIKNSELLKQWSRRLNREEFTPSKYSVLCSLHFTANDFVEESSDTNVDRKKKRNVSLTKRYLKDDAVPSVFPNLPQYFTRPQTKPRSGKATSSKRFEAEASMIERQSDEFLNVDKILSYEDLKEKFKKEGEPIGFLTYETDQGLNIIKVSESLPPKITDSIIVHKSLNVSVYHNDRLVQQKKIHHIIPDDRLSHISQLVNLVAFVKNLPEISLVDHYQIAIDSLSAHLSENDNVQNDETNRIKFLKEQLELSCQSKYARRYSPDTLVISYILHSYSSTMYTNLLKQNVLCLPSVQTIKNISRKLDSEKGLDDSEYLRMRLSKLSIFEVVVALVIDEIYLGKRVELTGGKIVGMTENCEVAQTALCFMITSLSSKYRDIVGIFPVKGLKAETLNRCYESVMTLIHSVGFEVVALLVDNAPANRKFYKLYLCNNEWKTNITNKWNGKNLYLLFDTTHNVKNLYNNFQSRKVMSCPAFPPYLSEATTAKFSDIENVYNHELHKPLKMAFKLNDSVIRPQNIEKTSVKLAAAVFDESTIAALRYFEHFETANFLSLIRKVWSILNVRHPLTGMAKRDDDKKPISDGDDRLDFLLNFADFLDTWENSGVSVLSLLLYGLYYVIAFCRS